MLLTIIPLGFGVDCVLTTCPASFEARYPTGRRPSFWQRRGRDGWYSTIGGRQIRLAETRADAEKEFYRRRLAGPASPNGPAFGEVVDRFLPWMRLNRKPSTAEQYRKTLRGVSGGLNNAMVLVQDRIEKKGIKLKNWFTLYSLRHTFATDLLRAKVPDTHVAALMGHRSTAILHRHYSHLTGDGDVLRGHLVALGG